WGGRCGGGGEGGAGRGGGAVGGGGGGAAGPGGGGDADGPAFGGGVEAGGEGAGGGGPAGPRPDRTAEREGRMAPHVPLRHRRAARVPPDRPRVLRMNARSRPPPKWARRQPCRQLTLSCILCGDQRRRGARAALVGLAPKECGTRGPAVVGR